MCCSWHFAGIRHIRTILVSFSIFRRAKMYRTKMRTVKIQSMSVCVCICLLFFLFYGIARKRMSDFFLVLSLVIVSFSAFEQATGHYHFYVYSIHTLNTLVSCASSILHRVYSHKKNKTKFNKLCAFVRRRIFNRNENKKPSLSRSLSPTE